MQNEYVLIWRTCNWPNSRNFISFEVTVMQLFNVFKSLLENTFQNSENMFCYMWLNQPMKSWVSYLSTEVRVCLWSVCVFVWYQLNWKRQSIRRDKPCIIYIHICFCTLKKYCLASEEVFTFVWSNAVVEYFCSTVSRITELSVGSRGSRVQMSSTHSLWQLSPTPYPVKSLLCVLDQVLHTAVQSNRSHQCIQIVKEI